MGAIKDTFSGLSGVVILSQLVLESGAGTEHLGYC